MYTRMKSRLPGATSLIPPSISPKLTLHILIVGKSFLWKVRSAQFLVLKICIDVCLGHKPEEACPRGPHLFLHKATGVRGLALPLPLLLPTTSSQAPSPGLLLSTPGKPTLSGHQEGQLSLLMSSGTTQP